MIYVWATLLVLANTVWAALNLLALPGNWLMVITTALVAWWQWDRGKPAGQQMFGIPVLVLVFLLAAAGEVVELLAGAAGARKAGGSRWGSLGALAGGFVGAIAGTFVIPIPVLGSVVGACGGAFLGAWGMEMLAGRKARPAVRSGVGAGAGRFVGTSLKILLGALIWAVIAVAAFWP